MQAPISPITGRPPIPAMTTDAERECFYRLARHPNLPGQVVELGAWLGASTAYIAAALRDREEGGKVHVYDKFLTKSGHIAKVEAWYNDHGLAAQAQLGDAYQQFLSNLGPLKAWVDAHQGEIRDLSWNGDTIAVLVNDAPKRVPEISSMLGKFAGALVPGSVMAWQDFCHFPSYEIPASLYRLRDHCDFVEAVVPGTTLVFQVTKAWTAAEVGADRLALASWTPDEIAAAWEYWLSGRVDETKAALFRCGQAMFLCDLGHHAEARLQLADVLATRPQDVIAKWQYLHRVRRDFRGRYEPLFKLLADMGLVS